MSSQNFSNDNQVWDTFFQSFLENFFEVLTMSYGIESLGMIYLTRKYKLHQCLPWDLVDSVLLEFFICNLASPYWVLFLTDETH